MKIIKKKLLIVVNIFIFILLVGCQTDNQNIKHSEKLKQFIGKKPKSLAILPFDNFSIDDRERYAPLSQGISAMITSDLQTNKTSFKIIERARIKSLFKEMAFNQSGALDSSVAVRTGKLLGAQAIAFGQFVCLDKDVRLDMRIINVETGEIILAESINGKSKNFLSLIKQLGQKTASLLDIGMTSDSVQSGGSVNAAIYLSKGIDAIDNANNNEAEKLFAQCIALDASYTTIIKKIKKTSQTNDVTEINSKEKEIEVKGYSVVSVSDAVKEAQRTAIETVAGVIIQSETVVENYDLVKDKIKTQSQGYIKKYSIIDEMKVDDKYVVKIKAVVLKDKIRNDIRAIVKNLLERMNFPTLLILVNETYINGNQIEKSEGINDQHDIASSRKPEIQDNRTQAELTALMKKTGFEIVDLLQLNSIKDQEISRLSLEGNTDIVKTIGLNSDAQYIIVGNSIIQDMGEIESGTKLRSFQVSLKLNVIHCVTGLVIGSVVKNGVNANISSLVGSGKAIEQAVNLAVNDYLVDTISEAFQEYVNNGIPCKINLTNITHYDQTLKVSSAIENFKQVVDLKTNGWNQVSGHLSMDLHFKGSTNELASMLSQLKFDQFTIEIQHVSPQQIDCKLQ